MTIAEQLRKEGRKQGLERGRKEGLERGREEGLETGLERGREEGREKGQSDLIREMLSRDVSIKAIANFTGLSLDRIKTLATISAA